MNYRLTLYGAKQWIQRKEILRYLTGETSAEEKNIKREAGLRGCVCFEEITEAKVSEMAVYLKGQQIDAEVEPMEIEESHKGWFLGEARKWVKRGLIFPYTFRVLLEHYGLRSELPAASNAQKKDPQSLVRAIVSIGAVLVGLGILLFIAANWQKFPDHTKILGSMASTLAFLYLGYGLQFRKTVYQKYAAPAYLISLLSVGGTVCLIGQIYHIQANSYELMLLWGALTLPVALGLGFYPAFFFTSGFWFLAELFYQGSFHVPSWWYPCLLLGFLIPYSIIKKKAALYHAQIVFLMIAILATTFTQKFIFTNIWLAAILLLWAIKREKLYEYLGMAGFAIWHIVFMQRYESFPDIFYLLPLGYFFWRGIQRKDNELLLANTFNALFWFYGFFWQLQQNFSMPSPHSSEILLSVLGLGILFYGIGLRLRNRKEWETLFNFFCYGGILLASVICVVFSFRFYEKFTNFFFSPIYLTITAGWAYGGCHFAFPVLIRDIQKDPWRGGEVIVLGLAVFALVATMLAGPSWMVHVVLFNLVLFSQGLVFMVKGQREQRVAFYHWGMGIFVGLIVLRYFDTFWAYMPRSFFFIGGGLFLIAWAIFIDRKKKTFMKSKEVLS